jgi:hypothetical protein
VRLYAFKVFVQFRTPLAGHVLRTDPMLVYAQNREIAARIAKDYHANHKVDGELPFVNLKDVKDLGPVAEGMV